MRALPLSRRPGFSKSPLRAALAEAGIEYVHLNALGTPAEGRAAARAAPDELNEIYAGQLESPRRSPKARRCSISRREKPSALLCYRAQPQDATARCCFGRAEDAEVVDLYA